MLSGYLWNETGIDDTHCTAIYTISILHYNLRHEMYTKQTLKPSYSLRILIILKKILSKIPENPWNHPLLIMSCP